jgi:hypothetical protein
MNDLFGQEILPRQMPLSRARITASGKKRYDIARGYAYPPGTGPAGETCKTCKFAVRIHYHDRTYYKCRKSERVWTHGPGTDIRLKSPACKLWEKEEKEK